MWDVIVNSSRGSHALANAMPRGVRKQLRWAGSYTCRYGGSKTFRGVVSKNLVPVLTHHSGYWPKRRDKGDPEQRHHSNDSSTTPLSLQAARLVKPKCI